MNENNEEKKSVSPNDEPNIFDTEPREPEVIEPVIIAPVNTPAVETGNTNLGDNAGVGMIPNTQNTTPVVETVEVLSSPNPHQNQAPLQAEAQIPNVATPVDVPNENALPSSLNEGGKPEAPVSQTDTPAPVADLSSAVNVEKPKTEGNVIVNQNGIVEVIGGEEENTKKEEGPKQNWKQKLKTNQLYIIIFIFIIVFVALLPFLNKLLTADNYNFLNGGETSNTSYNLIKGFMKIGNDTYMTVKDIKFSNPNKKNGDTIEINYYSTKTIEDVSSKNIYLNLYNQKEELVVQIPFTPRDNKVVENSTEKFTATLTSRMYEPVFYAKVEVVKEVTKPSETTMICKKTETIDSVNYFYTNTYFFGAEGLVRYDINRALIYTKELGTENIVATFEEKINNEYNLVKAYITNIEKDTNSLKYTVDLENASTSLPLLYEIKTSKNAVKDGETQEGWTCN